MALKTSDNGRKFIEGFEGLFLQSYDDHNDRIVNVGDPVYGVLTIGYGHTSEAGPPRVYPGMTIDRDTADTIMAADLASVEIEVNHLVTVPTNQNQFDALVSFHFNTGGLGRSSALRDINAGNFANVAADLALWNRAGGVVLKGLVRRRAAEGVLFNTPVENT
jgi:lysozyme